MADDLGIEFAAIKGLSDFADGKKSNIFSWTEFSSVMTASLTANILDDSIVFKNWPHYCGKY